jgi:hypothetical protein
MNFLESGGAIPDSASKLGLGFVAFLMQIVLAGGAVVFLDRKSPPLKQRPSFGGNP